MIASWEPLPIASQVPNFSGSEGNEKETILLMELSNCFWDPGKVSLFTFRAWK